MKIISLNIWAGIVGEPLINFFRENQDVDIFCLQEVMHEATEWTNWDKRQNATVFDQIRDVLPHHNAYFRAAEFKGEWGLAIFIKKQISVMEEGEVFIHLHKDSMKERDPLTVGKNLQWITIANRNLTICNVHGLWNGKGKTDTEDRINQSMKILEFTRSLSTEFVLCGDFNLLPDTESLKMFETAGLRNLITENGITSTRTSHYTKPDKFADYTFVTEGVTVKEFKVLPDEVSDHSPLYLEIK